MYGDSPYLPAPYPPIIPSPHRRAGIFLVRRQSSGKCLCYPEQHVIVRCSILLHDRRNTVSPFRYLTDKAQKKECLDNHTQTLYLTMKIIYSLFFSLTTSYLIVPPLYSILIILFL